MLNQKQQRGELPESDRQKLNALLEQYEQFMLVRAQAMALLKQRGHDVTEFFAE